MQGRARLRPWRVRGERTDRGNPPDPAARHAAQWSAGLSASPSAIPERPSGAARSERLEPGQRVPPDAAPVEREGDEFGAAADILPRHGPAEAALPFGHPAVGRIVAVVAHQPEVAGGNRDRSEIVLRRTSELDGLVSAPAGKGLADD